MVFGNYFLLYGLQNLAVRRYDEYQSHSIEAKKDEKRIYIISKIGHPNSTMQVNHLGVLEILIER
jgi:hypothetical protein